MGRVYHRDRLGRFASKGFSGQSGGRGARLMGPGKTRQGGGSRMRAAAPKGVTAKPRGLKPDPTARRRALSSSRNPNGVLGKVAQRRELRKTFDDAAKRLGIDAMPKRNLVKAGRPQNTLGRRFGQLPKTPKITVGQSARLTRSIGRYERKQKAAAAAGNYQAKALRALMVPALRRANSGSGVKLARSRVTSDRAIAHYNKTQGLNARRTTQKPSAVARKASKATSPKRLGFTLAYHGTSQEAAKAIKQSGYMESRSGAFGAGVYTSRSRKTADMYSGTMGGYDMRGGKVITNGRVLTHRIPKNKIERIREDTSATVDGHRKMQSQIRSSIQGRRVPSINDSLSVVLLPKGVADRTLVRSTGTIRRRRRRR